MKDTSTLLDRRRKEAAKNLDQNKDLILAEGLLRGIERNLIDFVKSEMKRLDAGETLDLEESAVLGPLGNAFADLEIADDLEGENHIAQAKSIILATIENCDKDPRHPSWLEAYGAAGALSLITDCEETERLARDLQSKVDQLFDRPLVV